ncbi:MAG: hypothetical protein RIC95_05935 [Vicingaceae bacterium]
MKAANPFNITKAVDYSDEEINKFWVDIPGGQGFHDIVKPTSAMPMIILGGKGSGKTHIMRFFSYSLQKLRHKESPLQGIIEDGYLGVYMRCSGLNSNRFAGKQQEKDTWKVVFAYYMEIWLTQLLLNNVKQLLGNCSEFDPNIEVQLHERISNLFDVAPPSETPEEKTLAGLIKFLRELQRKVDFEVNNCAITGKPIKEIEISATSGNLIFGIPKVLAELIPEFSGIKFLYLLDELENLSEEQQKYINTLIREKEDPATFRIGSRLYGMKTYMTFSGGEEIKNGSEYEMYNIDEFFREKDAEYKEFVKAVCLKRLNTNGFSVKDATALDSFFEKPSISELVSKRIKKEKRHLTKLKGKLKVKPKEEVSKIISDLSFEDPLLERTNVFIFYRLWKKSKTADLLQISNNVKEDCLKFHNTKDSSTEHHKILDKYKNDIRDQLCRDLGLPIYYLGLDTYIKMSCGIPRHLLIILKHIYRWSSFNGEDPFRVGNRVSVNSQQKGLKEATDWFFNDARMPGLKGNEVQAGLIRMGRFLQDLRFSDQPPECSISSFSVKLSVMYEKSNLILDFLEKYSYLVKVSERRDKNSNRRDLTFQVNGLLSPIWELSIHRRGIVSLSEIEVKAIFEPETEQEFNKALSIRKAKYNAPFSIQQPGLF